MIQKLLKVPFFSDPGHGWAAVSRAMIEDLEIADKITPYSYQYEDTVFLEEDGDLHTLCRALNDRGIVLKLEENYEDFPSPIRSYESYKY